MATKTKKPAPSKSKANGNKKAPPKLKRLTVEDVDTKAGAMLFVVGSEPAIKETDAKSVT